MPRMNILNAVEQEAFESAPVFNLNYAQEGYLLDSGSRNM